MEQLKKKIPIATELLYHQAVCLAQYYSSVVSDCYVWHSSTFETCQYILQNKLVIVKPRIVKILPVWYNIIQFLK